MTGTAGLAARGARAARDKTDAGVLLAEIIGPREAREAGADVSADGPSQPVGYVLLEGWAGTATTITRDRRQVTDLLLPGDLWLPCRVASADRLLALTAIAVAPVPLDGLREAGRATPELWWNLVGLLDQQDARLRQQVVRNGRRSAHERVAHLLLELYERLRIKGRARDDTFDLPIGQSVIADAVGLSYVHVSRVLTQLERTGMIERGRTRVRIRDRAAIEAACGFDAAYLAPGALR